MLPRDRIASAIARRRAAGEPALIAFVTAGYPRPENFLATLERVGAAADAIEIGVPFSDPMADGVTIQRASRAAIEAGVSLRWIFERLAARVPRPDEPPLLLMTYMNPLLAFGFERLGARAAETGVAGFIVPDLPYEESGELHAALAPHGLALVQLVTPATPTERLATLCAASEGFVYAVTRTGITGAAALPTELARYLEAVKAASTIPVCAGFGVRRPEHVRLIAGHADGVVVGSALVEALERGEDPAAFLQALRGAGQTAAPASESTV